MTKRLADVKAILEPEGERDSEPDMLKLAQLKLTLKEKLDILKQLDNEILDLLETEADISTEIKQSDTFNMGLYEALVKIEKYGEASPRDTPPTVRTSTCLEEGGRPLRSKARLPKLTLHSFDGDVTKWVTFWDSYNAAIHSNPNLSSIDKFTYLQSLVELLQGMQSVVTPSRQ